MRLFKQTEITLCITMSGWESINGSYADDRTLNLTGFYSYNRGIYTNHIWADHIPLSTLYGWYWNIQHQNRQPFLQFPFISIFSKSLIQVQAIFFEKYRLISLDAKIQASTLRQVMKWQEIWVGPILAWVLVTFVWATRKAVFQPWVSNCNLVSDVRRSSYLD